MGLNYYNMNASQRAAFDKQMNAFDKERGAIQKKSNDGTDASKCRENGKWDNDCCAQAMTASCADHYTRVMSDDQCASGKEQGYVWIAYNYKCVNPGQEKVYKANLKASTHGGVIDPSMCRDRNRNGGEMGVNKDCCAQ